LSADTNNAVAKTTPEGDNPLANIMPENFSEVMRFGTMLSKSKLVPKHLQGEPDSCSLVVIQAVKWRMDPFSVAQKTHVIEGTLGYEAQLVNAIVNTMAPTRGRIQYEWFGPWENVIGKTEEKTAKSGFKYRVLATSPKDEQGCGVKVWATLKGENEPRVLELLLTQATVRNSTNWASDPKQQLAYLAVKKWVRLHCPEILNGVYTIDELEDHAPIHQSADLTEPEEPKQMLTIGSEPEEDEATEAEVIDDTPEASDPAPPPTEDELTQLKELAWSTGRVKTKDVYFEYIREAIDNPVPIEPEALNREQYEMAIKFFEGLK